MACVCVQSALLERPAHSFNKLQQYCIHTYANRWLLCVIKAGEDSCFEVLLIQAALFALLSPPAYVSHIMVRGDTNMKPCMCCIWLCGGAANGSTLVYVTAAVSTNHEPPNNTTCVCEPRNQLSRGQTRNSKGIQQLFCCNIVLQHWRAEVGVIPNPMGDRMRATHIHMHPRVQNSLDAHLRNRLAILVLDTVFLLATASSGTQSMATMRSSRYRKVDRTERERVGVRARHAARRSIEKHVSHDGAPRPRYALRLHIVRFTEFPGPKLAGLHRLFSSSTHHTAPHHTMAVNEHRPTVADVKFQVKEGSALSSATFIFG